MKILFATAGTYVPTHSGASKINRTLAEALAARGHDVTFVGLARSEMRRGASLDDFLSELQAREIAWSREGTAVHFSMRGVRVCAVDGALEIAGELTRLLEHDAPDHVLVPSEDWKYVLLRAAAGICPDRIVYLAQTTTSLPFGPCSIEPDPEASELVGRARQRIALSQFLSRYIADHGGLRCATVYPATYEESTAPRYRNFERRTVTTINPCGVKGICIFLGLARRFPDLPFIAVPTWGTSIEELDQLRQLPNVELAPPSDRLDDFLARTSILLVPSLWMEAFGMVVVDAMLRGIPVVASAIGGLVEAKLGTAFSIPVRPIERYRRFLIPTGSIIPEQDLTPWCEAIRSLTRERPVYELESERSWSAARRFVNSLDIDAYKNVLRA